MEKEPAPEEYLSEFQIQGIVDDIGRVTSKLRRVDWDDLRTRRVSKRNFRHPFINRNRKNLELLKENLVKESIEETISLLEAARFEVQKLENTIATENNNLDTNFVEKRLNPEYYEYVKTDQDVLESVLKARYNLTDEVAKAFSAKVDTAARIQKLRDELEWPPTKIELYEHRKPLPETGKKETAIEFYNRVWKSYADAWLISQDILKNKFGEDKLVPGIKSQCHREHRDFVKHAPPSQVKLNDYLASIDLGGTARSYLEKNRARASKFRNDTLK